MRLLADENMDGRVIRGLQRRIPGVDLVRVIDVGLSGRDDPQVLAWAASENRMILTHDVTTMVNFAYERIESGLLMPGVIEVPLDVAVGRVIEDLVLLHHASLQEEWDGQIIYLPL